MTGKAKHPHNTKRPAPQRVLDAIEVYERTGKIDQLREALSFRQRRYAEEFVVDFNKAQAALRAGYAAKDIDKQAYIVSHHKGVMKYIDHLSATKASKIVSVNPDYVLREITEVISKPGVRDGDKLRALELLARHLGMFIERTEITGKDGEAIRIEQQKVKEEADDFINTIKRMANKKDIELV